MSPVCGADARRDPFSRLDGYGERRLKRRLVPGDHHGEVKPIHHFGRKRKADQATPISRHEIDRLRCRFLRRNAQIALVFTIFVIYQYDGLSEHYIFKRLGNRCQRHRCLLLPRIRERLVITFRITYFQLSLQVSRSSVPCRLHESVFFQKIEIDVCFTPGLAQACFPTPGPFFPRISRSCLFLY